MNKIFTMVMMGIMAISLTTIGIWHSFDDVRWLLLAGIGIVGIFETNRIFNSLPQGEIEVEEDEAI